MFLKVFAAVHIKIRLIFSFNTYEPQNPHERTEPYVQSAPNSFTFHRVKNLTIVAWYEDCNISEHEINTARRDKLRSFKNLTPTNFFTGYFHRRSLLSMMWPKVKTKNILRFEISSINLVVMVLNSPPCSVFSSVNGEVNPSWMNWPIGNSSSNFTKNINPFHATGFFLYPLKTSENIWFQMALKKTREFRISEFPNLIKNLKLICE